MDFIRFSKAWIFFFFTGMGFKVASTFYIVFNKLFLLKKNSACRLLITNRSQFWKPLLEDRQPLQVLSLGLQVLKKETENHLSMFKRMSTITSTTIYDYLTEMWCLNADFLYLSSFTHLTWTQISELLICKNIDIILTATAKLRKKNQEDVENLYSWNPVI